MYSNSFHIVALFFVIDSDEYTTTILIRQKECTCGLKGVILFNFLRKGNAIL